MGFGPDVRRSLATAGLVASIGFASTVGRASPRYVDWAAETASPIGVEVEELSALERAALDRCGSAEAGLITTARWILERKREGGSMPDTEAITFRQRMAGEPHPWIEAWTASMGANDVDAALTRLAGWVGSARGPSSDSRRRLRRCGVASGAGRNGARLLVVVAVDALADLSPVPVRLRTGQWVRIDAKLAVPATGAQVVVLGPDGWPRPLPTSFDAPWVRARFAPDQLGEFDFEVMADTAEGTRPVLEGSVFTDVLPPLRQSDIRAPGEPVAGSPANASPMDTETATDALAHMTAAARGAAGLGPLCRDARLDRIAREHAARMASAQALAHDVGAGNPLERMRAIGLEPRDAGENVAHAVTVAQAHRAMWRSPAHRANTVRRDFDRFGVSVVSDVRGDVWTVVEFAGGL